jgi:hypothetical protein
MQKVGIDADIEELGHVLGDVKLWATGVNEIRDIETQVWRVGQLADIS